MGNPMIVSSMRIDFFSPDIIYRYDETQRDALASVDRVERVRISLPYENLQG
jgi:hypothetical protein